MPKTVGSGVTGGDKRYGLTGREIEVLRWLAEGKTSWEVSQILSISEKTVEAHFASIARKLDASNRIHAVARALRAGLIH